MAQYKVPQDVEADDKLLGPFTFRQFIYLLVAAGFIALAWTLFQVFPGLVIIPIPIVLFFGALALPLKKDQPMETYLAAIVSFYLKPRTRLWESGQAESTIQITAPKQKEENRSKNLSRDEASHRLSFLAEIVDSGGYSIKGAVASPLKEEFYAEANTAEDIFEANPTSAHIEQAIQDKNNIRHQELVKQMRQAIEKAETIHNIQTPSIAKFGNTAQQPQSILNPPVTQSTVVTPTAQSLPPNGQNSVIITPQAPSIPETKATAPADIVELANNTDFSVETIAKEAKRLEQKHDENEVYISLQKRS